MSASVDLIDCKQIVVQWLESHGLDGLCEPETECGCGLADFAPCGEGPYPHCRPAMSRVLGEGEYIGDGGPGDIAYFVTPHGGGEDCDSCPAAPLALRQGAGE